jgi:hypothetical protein
VTGSDWIWLGFRLFDCLAPIAVCVLFWRDTKRRVRCGKTDMETARLRLSLLAYVAGTSVLFGRSLVQDAPGGWHLAFIAVPLLWCLRVLIRSEIQHGRARQ